MCARESVVKKFDTGKEFYIDEGCHIIELINSVEDPEVSVARARVEPGVTTHWHRLQGVVERYLIQEGEGVVEIGDHPPEKVGPGDTVNIPPMCAQRISNSGTQDLLFLAICTPRFTPECYQELESNSTV